MLLLDRFTCVYVLDSKEAIPERRRGEKTLKVRKTVLAMPYYFSFFFQILSYFTMYNHVRRAGGVQPERDTRHVRVFHSKYIHVALAKLIDNRRNVIVVYFTLFYMTSSETEVTSVFAKMRLIRELIKGSLRVSVTSFSIALV
jgi:hypothetical protein